VLAEHWRLYNKPSMFVEVEQFALRVRGLGKTLFVIADVPSYKNAPSDIAARIRIIAPRRDHSGLGDLWQSEAEYNRVEAAINRNLADVCQKTGAVLVPLNMAFKEDGHYIAFAQENGRLIPLYSDSHHVSPAGSLRAAHFLLPYVFPEKPSSLAKPDA